MDTDMFTTMLRCSRCGWGFRTDLSKMRLNAPNLCPSCGAPCEISSDQAIGSHRLLERLELKNRMAAAAAREKVRPGRSLSSLLFGDLLDSDDSRSG